MVYELCTAIDANYSSWGNCLGGMFFNDPVFIVVGILAILAFVAYKMNLPHEVSLLMGVGVVFMMALVFSSPVLYSLAALAVVIIAVYLVRGLMKPGKK